MNDVQNRERARAYFDYYISEQRAAQQYHVDLGKWLLASLVLINGGAITVLAQAQHSTALKASGVYFVWGVIAAILCGFSSWINAGIRDAYLDQLAKPEMLVSDAAEDWPKEDPSRIRWMVASLWGSIIFGLASLLLFGLGATSVGHVL